MVLLRSLPPPADLRVTTHRRRAARRTNSLKSTGPRTPDGKQRSCAGLKRHLGRLLAGPRQGHRLRLASDRKLRFTPVPLRVLGLAKECRPTVPAETPGKYEITSTAVSWNVPSNQRHGSKRGARP